MEGRLFHILYRSIPQKTIGIPPHTGDPAISEFVCNTRLDTGYRILLQTGKPVPEILVVIIGIGDVSIKRCPLGEIIGITDRIPVGILRSSPSCITFGIAQAIPLNRCIQSAGTDIPFQTGQQVSLSSIKRIYTFGIRRISSFPSLAVRIFVGKRNPYGISQTITKAPTLQMLESLESATRLQFAVAEKEPLS